ncbi:MAG: glycosyltransferase family 39 protein [Planctomycetota bacterium]
MPRQPGLNDPATGPGAVRSGLFVALCLLPLFFSLGNHEITGDSEARYGLVARGMAFGGASWWVPTLLGEPHLTKPPLTYWLHAASLRALGDNLWALRLPGAVCGGLTLGIVYLLAHHLRGPGAGTLAAGMLAITPLFVIVHRLALTDPPLTLFSTSLLAAVVMATRSPNSARWCLIAGLAASMGWLTKGPALLPTAAAAVLWLLLGRSNKNKLNLIIVLLVSLFPLAGWACWIAAKLPEAWEVWRFQTLSRATGRGDHPEPWWFLIPVFFLGALPATALLPWRGPSRNFGTSVSRTVQMFRGAQAPDPKGLWVLHLLATLFFFSLISGKLMSYPAPAAPSLVLLITAWFTERSRQTKTSYPNLWQLFKILQRPWFITAVALPSAAGLVLSVFTGWVIGLCITAGGWGLAGLWLAGWAWKRRGPDAALPLGYAWVLGLLTWTGLALAEDGYAHRSRLGPVVAELRRATGLTEPRVYTVGFTDRRLPFFTNRPTRRIDPRVLPEVWMALPREELVLLAEPEAWASFDADPHWDLDSMYEVVAFHVEHLRQEPRYIAFRPTPR